MKKVLLSVAALFAAVSLSAQDLTAVYNEAAAAYGAKDFAGAAAKFQQVIDEGMDSDGAASLVATAKSTLPKCYFMMGGYAAQAKKYDEAITNFTKSAELAELYGDMTQMTKSKQWVAKIYQMQGGEAFNSKDYATASEIFAKGYAADPRNTDMALNLAMSYCELGKYAEGMAIYEDIAALTNPKYEEAVARYDRALKYDRTMTGAMNNKGLALSCLGKHLEAHDCFRRVLIALPTAPDIWYNKGYELLQLGEINDAVEAFNTALSYCSNDDTELKVRINVEKEKALKQNI